MALHLLVADVDTVWQRALDAGAEGLPPAPGQLLGWNEAAR